MLLKMCLFFVTFFPPDSYNYERQTPLLPEVVCSQMLDFVTSNSKPEVSKSNSWKTTSLAKTTLLQREPFLTTFLYYQPLPITRYIVRFYAYYFECPLLLRSVTQNVGFGQPKRQLVLCFTQFSACAHCREHFWLTRNRLCCHLASSHIKPNICIPQPFIGLLFSTIRNCQAARANVYLCEQRPCNHTGMIITNILQSLRLSSEYSTSLRTGQIIGCQDTLLKKIPDKIERGGGGGFCCGKQ